MIKRRLTSKQRLFADEYVKFENVVIKSKINQIAKDDYMFSNQQDNNFVSWIER